MTTAGPSDDSAQNSVPVALSASMTSGATTSSAAIASRCAHWER